jgi:guanylate kinase
MDGAEKFCKIFPESITLFVFPPSLKELRIRIKKRDKNDSIKYEQLNTMIGTAQQEMQYCLDDARKET